MRKPFVSLILCVASVLNVAAQLPGGIDLSKVDINELMEMSRKPGITIENSDFGYRNPVITGMAPDPSVCRKGDDFYLVTSTFWQYPGLPIYHSKDLIHWDLVSYAATEEQGLDTHKGAGLFAPTIRYNKEDDTFYVICTSFLGDGVFITTAKDPAGKWGDFVWMKHPALNGMDPSLCFDGGKCYYTGNGDEGIVIAEINPLTGENYTEPMTLYIGSGGISPEGSHLYHTQGAWYLMLAEGGTEFTHQVHILRSNSPYGPWEYYDGNPILGNSFYSLGETGVGATGHGDLIDAPDGSWWMVYLATRQHENYFAPLARETHLAPVKWSRDHWPIVNTTSIAEIDMLVRTLKQTEPQGTDLSCDYDDKAYPLRFTWFHNPVWENYSIGGGVLKIKAADDRSSFVGIRQQDFSSETETAVVGFRPKGGDEAGLCVRHSLGGAYCTIGLSSDGGKYYVTAHFVIGRNTEITNREEIPQADTVRLRAVSTRYEYDMQYSMDGSNWKSLGKVDSKHFSGGFSGVIIGQYVSGTEGSVASFDYFRYTGKDDKYIKK